MKQKKKKNDDVIRLSIKEVIAASKTAKDKKRAIQQECPHQKPNGHQSLVPVYDQDGQPIRGLLKCKRCGAKIDLRYLKNDNGDSTFTVIKNGYKVMSAASQYLKLCSAVNKKEDELCFRIATKCQKYNYKIFRIFKTLQNRNIIIAKNKNKNRRVRDVAIFAGGRGILG